MDSLLSFLLKFGIVPDSDAGILRHYARQGSLKAGEFFLKPGQTCHECGFILKGVVRVSVRNEDGKEITRGFPAEGNFMIDLESYNNQKSSIEYWEAMVDLEFLFWNRADIKRMEQEITCWQAILVPMVQSILLLAANERSEMFSDDATNRYSKFLDRYPRIVARVPLRYIANYLGIAPQSLSRIRQKALKNFN